MAPREIEPKHTVAIIPARGGSKRMPRKNIRPFSGKPMIQYSIEAALESKLFDRVVVTTDDQEIAAFSQTLGADVPMLRPAELSDDHTTMLEVYRHALAKMVPAGSSYTRACLLLATAPFLRASTLRKSAQEWLAAGTSSMCAVTSFPFPIFRAFKKNAQGNLEWVWPEHQLTRSNDLPEAFHDAGQFYWVKTDFYLSSGRVVQADTTPFFLPRHLVQDIDTPEDWEHAELLYSCMLQEKGKT